MIKVSKCKHFIPYYGLFSCDIQVYVYVISEWRSIRPVEINQYGITNDTHYDITMGNDVAMDNHCYVTMSNDIAIGTYHGVTMHNDIAVNIFRYVFSALCLIVLFYYR